MVLCGFVFAITIIFQLCHRHCLILNLYHVYCSISCALRGGALFDPASHFYLVPVGPFFNYFLNAIDYYVELFTVIFKRE